MHGGPADVIIALSRSQYREGIQTDVLYFCAPRIHGPSGPGFRRQGFSAVLDVSRCDLEYEVVDSVSDLSEAIDTTEFNKRHGIAGTDGVVRCTVGNIPPHYHGMILVHCSDSTSRTSYTVIDRDVPCDIQVGRRKGYWYVDSPRRTDSQALSHSCSPNGEASVSRAVASVTNDPLVTILVGRKVAVPVKAYTCFFAACCGSASDVATA